MLPQFEPNDKEKGGIKNEIKTAKFVQYLWNKTSPSDHADPKFLKMLIQSTWVNGKGHGDALRRWRNKHIASWLGFPKITDEELAKVLSKKLHISVKEARKQLRTDTGITHYYHPFRKKFLTRVDKNSVDIRKAFQLLASNKQKYIEETIRNVAELIFKLHKFPIPKKKNQKKQGSTSMMNGLSPALACMDVARCFPIVNAKTERLLFTIGQKPDKDGILSLIQLIGQNGIKDSFSLDVYAMTNGKRFKPRRTRNIRSLKSRDIRIKSEKASIAYYAKHEKTIQHEHNKLINKFKGVLNKWKHPLEESDYDALIRKWREGRDLLIEAKTATAGSTGRTQLRQAIGQLFDYRYTHFHKDMDKVDIALLTPTKPERKILDLLKSLKIEALWFEDEKLKGTIKIA